MLKIKKNHILVFAVTNKKKFGNFFTPQTSSYADYFELMEVWIAAMGAECYLSEEGVGLGAKCYVLDTYELDTQIPMSHMKDYGELVDFSDDILNVAKATDGCIEAFVIHENSLLGVEDSSWKKNPILSWGPQDLASPNLEVPRPSILVL